MPGGQQHRHKLVTVMTEGPRGYEEEQQGWPGEGSEDGQEAGTAAAA